MSSRAALPPVAVAVGVAVAVVVAVVVAAVAWRQRARRRRRRESFVQALIGGAMAAAGIGVPFIAKAISDKKNKVKPAYRGRVQDGYDWSCPDNTVETGAVEDAKACITGEYHPPVWKAGPDGKWDHLCPNGTVPAPEKDWNKKCLVGWTGRVQSGGEWVCPGDTWDTGNNWGNASWHDAQKQCKRSKAYTQRVFANGAWVCPPGTKDTGKTWTDKVHGAKQCKWTGP